MTAPIEQPVTMSNVRPGRLEQRLQHTRFVGAERRAPLQHERGAQSAGTTSDACWLREPILESVDVCWHDHGVTSAADGSSTLRRLAPRDEWERPVRSNPVRAPAAPGPAPADSGVSGRGKEPHGRDKRHPATSYTATTSNGCVADAGHMLLIDDLVAEDDALDDLRVQRGQIEALVA